MAKKILSLALAVATTWVALGQSRAELRAEAAALYPLRYEAANLERLIALHEQLLAQEPGSRGQLALLAQLWYEWAALAPEAREEEGLRRAADYGSRALGLNNLAELQGISEGALRSLLDGVTDPAYTLWTAHSWGLLLGRMNPLAAFASLGKIRILYERVIALDPGYFGGSGPQAYGALLANLSDYGILFGVKLSEAKAFLEWALELDPAYLENHVAYAWEYARRAKDRALFESLLKHVLEAPIGEWTFWNRHAKEKAGEYLAKVGQLFR